MPPEMIDPNLSTGTAKFLGRSARERLLGQRGTVIWLYGLSGAGKTTIATAVERRLHEMGRLTTLIDGDQLRTGLNRGLGFTDEDRRENLRRAGEVARLFCQAGVITLGSFITPTRALRSLVRQIVGEDDFLEVYVKASFDACRERDVKGLYAKAAADDLKNFTGRDSGFEEPEAPDLVLDTEVMTEAEAVQRLVDVIVARGVAH
jgi:adenylylsulfate kinase